ncbi:MAG: hypothetical protein GXY34_12265, partial [Syntrophomonadaceae bacterium]|nr:hypothetical protein [Syntrophomonadaceae bacterium]
SYTATTDGIYLLDVIGLSYLIADITAYTSGTITAVAQAVPLAISLPGGVIDSNGCQAVKLSGSIPEYGWLNTDTPPAPADPAKLALGVEINTTTHKMTTKYWNGSAWVEVE